MQIQHVRYFLALCEELNFTRAARRCGISQPTLTNAVGKLEQELGGPLFQRRPEIALTALGHAVRPYLHEIEQCVGAAHQVARNALMDESRASQAPVAHRAREPVE